MLNIFSHCSSLVSVNLPEGLRSLDGFMNCNNLAKITIPSTVEIIKRYAFAYCSNLNSVIIPEKTERLEDNVFYDCKSLESIEIRGNVSSFGTQVFRGCNNLQTIISHIMIPPYIQDGTFSVYDTATLMVPAGTIDNYKKTAGWKNFRNIVEITGQNKESKAEAFYIYRNDGGFNAFFCDEVDSIAYSPFDTDGQFYDEIVTQLVYTHDSVYRIPLAAIDSVAFRVNEISVSQDYLPVDEDGYTIASANIEEGHYVLLFNGSVPDIREGNVMTLIGDSIYQVIRVKTIQCSGQQVTLTTEEASLGDVFTSGSFTLSTESFADDNYNISGDGSRVFYPYEVSYYDDKNQYQRIRSLAPRKAENGKSFEYTIDFSGHEFYNCDSVKLYIEKCRFDLAFDYKISCNFNSFGEGFDNWRNGELVLHESTIHGKVDTDFMLRFDAYGKKKGKLDDFIIKKNYDKPVVMKFIVAEVPVVVISTVHLMGSGSYDVEGNFSLYSGFKASASTEMGCSWTQGDSLKTYASFGKDFKLYNPTIEGNAHLEGKFSVFPSITFSIYGLLGPTFNIKPYQRHVVDVGLYDELFTHNDRDFFGAEYNEYVGFDAAIGLSFFSILGEKPFLKTDDKNFLELQLYEGPKLIKFEKASQDTIVVGSPVDVSFSVSDLSYYPKLEVAACLPYAVKFVTNSGFLNSNTKENSTYVIIDSKNGMATVKWTPGSETIDGKADYISALLYDRNGKIITSDSWIPKKAEAYTAYAVLKDDVLTFYYDLNKEKRDGKIYEIGNGEFASGSPWAKTTKKVVFDSSFAYYRPISTKSWFKNCSRLEKIENIHYLNTANVTKMNSMFYCCSLLTNLDVSKFNTSNVTNMDSLFFGCSQISNLDISNFNTANVSSMRCMFSYCQRLTELNLRYFDTTKVIDMSYMFSSCIQLKNLDLRNFNTANVTDMRGMFQWCRYLISLDVSNFNTGKVKDMSYMFNSCQELTVLDIRNFETTNVTDMNNMFLECYNLKKLDLRNFNTANVTNMKSMFRLCRSLTELNVSNFNTSNVTNMDSMFSGCSGLTNLDVSNFNTGKVKDMNHMFSGCSGLTNLDVSNFNTANVTNMSYMFNGCSGLTNLDVSNFNTANVTDMSYMFNGCRGLTKLDLTVFVNVVNAQGMFHSCSSLETIYSRNWNPKSSPYMFECCYKLVGGNGTKIGLNLYGYDANGKPLYYECRTGGYAAHIDGGKDNPGLFTAK